MNKIEWIKSWKGIQKKEDRNIKYTQSVIRLDVLLIGDLLEKTVVIKKEKTLVLAFNM